MDFLKKTSDGRPSGKREERNNFKRRLGMKKHVLWVAVLAVTAMAVVQGQAAIVGDWKINEGSGTALADSSGNGNTANAYWAINGWDTTGTKVPANPALGVPSDGKSISLQAQEYITLASGSNTLVNNTFGGAFTLFYRFSNDFGASFSVSKGNLSITTVAEWSNWNWIDVSADGTSIANGVDAFVSNTPKDIAVTWDPSTSLLSVFMDGQLKQVWSAPVSQSFQNTSDLTIARQDRAGSNKAWIESVRLYNVALNSTQVQALSTVPEPATMLMLVAGAVLGIYRKK
jgi:hypothetical protein